jgi:hypothetical protein
MGRVGVDTNVLILAATSGLLDVQGSAYSQIVAAKRVLDEGGEIVVPAPVWFEVLRGADPQAVASLRGLQGRWTPPPRNAAPSWSALQSPGRSARRATTRNRPPRAGNAGSPGRRVNS